MNSVVVSGNLVADPTEKDAGGTPFTTASVAVNRNFKNKEGNYDTDFFNMSAFSYPGKQLAQCKKGEGVVVHGQLRQSTWTDKDGNKRSAVEITVDQIHKLGKIMVKSAEDQQPQEAASEVSGW
jgi:single-strand DNA-binding protein